MDIRPPTGGIVLRCDLDGIVLQVLHDDLDLALEANGRPFPAMVDRPCLAKALDFWVEIKAKGGAFGYELTIVRQQRAETLLFAGVRHGDEIMIGGTHTPDDMIRLCEELTRVNNAQCNMIRRLTKAQVERSTEAPRSEDALYDKMTRLNNDLVTAQRDLAKKNHELQRLNEIKDQFLGLAAHDLRSPLGVIMVYSEFLLDASDVLTAEQREFLDVIHSSSQFMLQLVNELLDVATIQAGKLALDREPLDLAALIAQHVARERVLAEKKYIEVRFEYAGGPLIAAVDGPKIEQVLYNLLSNAAKYSFPHSTIRVRLARRDGCALIAVQDEGQGIPEAELGRLFQAFGRTSVRPTGDERSTGLGLAIVQNIVRGHGGTVTVESRVGQGSTFTVSLPLDPAAAGDSTTLPAVGQPPPAGMRVLVVEDDRLTGEVAERILGRQGHHVTCVATGHEAVAAALGSHLDLILMDLHMPDMGGLEATAAIRAGERAGHHRRVPIIGMSGSSLPADIEAGQAAGMDAYLVKPLDAGQLARTVARLVGAAGARTAFDLEGALDMVDGDRDFLRELAEIFMLDASLAISGMRRAIEAADAAALERWAHKLKGAAISLRARGVHAAASRLEDAARQARLSEADDILAHLDDEMASLEMALKSL